MEVEGLFEGGSQPDDVSVVELRLLPDKFPKKTIVVEDPVRSVPGHWRIDLHVNKDVLRAISMAPVVSSFVNSIQPMSGHKEKVFTVIAELVNNAVDHGVLGLDSSLKKDPEGFSQYFRSRDERLSDDEAGWVSVSIEHRADGKEGILELVVEDSGDGFDQGNVGAGLADNSGYCGRGLPLVKSLCQSLVYNDKGNGAAATYRWLSE
jgi:anti-sigma regulatory factor (Ser/Thr protein kinase)